MKMLYLLICMVSGVAFASASEHTFSSAMISSPVAVSQSGRFTATYYVPLIIDNNASLNLTNFIAYRNVNTKRQILLGAIPGNKNLNFLCSNPDFLINEKLADVSRVDGKNIHYFKMPNYKGCIINFAKNQSAIIIALPKAFVNQGGDNIRLVGVVGNKKDILELKSKISFQVTAEEFFINMLQLGQAFSPFSKEIDWDVLKQQGLEFIGKEEKTCRGLSAAATFLVPALRQQDFHSSTTLAGLNSQLCLVPPAPEDAEIKKWLSVPKQIRNPIVKYSSSFHGYKINKHIAYLYVPAIEAYDLNTINKKIKNGREALNKAGINSACGFIVDLRFNMGGNLQSMLLTLGGEIPDGQLFNLGKNSPVYLSGDGNKLSINTSHDFYGKFNGLIPRKNRNKPVAILVNWMTASSGELTALALHENSSMAMIFGTATSPTASVNATFYLLDGNTLNLTVDRVYNNKGLMMPLTLTPQKEVEDNLQTIFNPDIDLTLTAAKQWLESLPACRKKHD